MGQLLQVVNLGLYAYNSLRVMAIVTGVAMDMAVLMDLAKVKAMDLAMVKAMDLVKVAMVKVMDLAMAKVMDLVILAMVKETDLVLMGWKTYLWKRSPFQMICLSLWIWQW